MAAPFETATVYSESSGRTKRSRPDLLHSPTKKDVANGGLNIINEDHESGEGTPRKEKMLSKNNIKDIKSFKQLDKVNLDVDSPRFA
jgi:hypothetical protein